MERLLGAFATIGDTKVRWDDDLVDRLNHRYTTFILVIFAIVVSTKQYVGEPINCWCPAEFTGLEPRRQIVDYFYSNCWCPAEFTDNHEDFTNKICWVQNTYYVPISQKKLPDADEEHARIQYYQWVPMILLTQAVMFYIPCLIWRFLSNKGGVDLNNIVEAAITLQHGAYQDQRIKTLLFIAKHLDRYLESARDRKRGCFTNCKHFLGRNCFLFCGKRYGNYIVVLYLVSKILYLGNVIGQLFLLNAFLGSNYHAYGYEVLFKMLSEEGWNSSERFPRVTMCDFYVRKLANIHRHTVQCVLPINLFNEKIYIFLWFWFIFDALITLLNVVLWLVRIWTQRLKIRYIRHRLCETLKDDLPAQDKVKLKHFTLHYLRQDGMLVLRLVGINANEIVVGEVVKELWLNYKAKKGGNIYVRPDPSAPLMENGVGLREQI